MDEEQDAVAGGSVLVVHHVLEGKHQYEVENVVQHGGERRHKHLFRRGDQLMQINDVDLQLLTPEEFAQVVAGRNPLLTVHRSNRRRTHEERTFSDEDLHAVAKETTQLSFCMEMVREEGVEKSEAWPSGGEDGENEEEDGGEDEDVEVEEGGEVCVSVCPDEDVRTPPSDLLVVTMTRTSITVVRGRSCDTHSPCGGCEGVGCVYNDIVMVTESSMVTLVPRGGGVTFRHLRTLDTPIEHVASHQYLRGICSQKSLYSSPNPETITIYSYKSNSSEPFRGTPVVLNFTGSDCFLRCYSRGSQVLLQMEAYDKQKLRHIARSDANTLSFVFYMKSDGSDRRRFESALHHGWFIQIADNESVGMGTEEGPREHPSFLFIIQT